jgi:hypothetical protein
MKKNAFLFAVVLAACSGRDNPTREKQNFDTLSRECSLSIALFGMPEDDRFTAIFNMQNKYPDTLFVQKCTTIEGNDSCEVQRIHLDSIAQDSAYFCFQEIKTNFRLKGTTDVMDGAKVNVSIKAGGSSVNYFYSGLSEAKDADPSVARLINFINRKLPKDFQMY